MIKLRIKLHKLGSDERYHFTATFERFGQKPAYRSSTPDKTVLLKDVKCDGDFVAEHLWFNYTKGFQKLYLKKRDKISFHGRVKGYIKGYKKWDKEVDFKISYPTKIEKL